MSLLDLLPAIAFALFVWWFGTGAILWLDRLPRRTYGWSFAGASLLSLGAIGAIIASAGDKSAMGAMTAFLAAIIVWGWHEMSFLMGFISGPRKTPCPADARGWRRFRIAAETLIHHEIALALTGVALLALIWGQPNQVAALTFLILWAMRLSTKLNIHLGVPRLTEEFLPEHLQHLKSYFRKRPVTALFPLSLLAGAGAAIVLARMTFAPEASQYEAYAAALLMTITLLGLIEHLFLYLPLPDAALWRWAMPSPQPRLSQDPVGREK